MLSVIPSIIVLGTAMVAAGALSQSRPSPPEKVAERRAASRALAIAVVFQGIHFTEEATTGLPVHLGALFGEPAPVPLSVFVAINVTWIVIWIASVPGLRSSNSGAFFAAWFLALAGMINVIIHPLLALAAGGYFPGVVSSSLTGAAAVWLWFKLRAATRPTQSAAA